MNVEKNINITPNEDILGCPSWCKNYNQTLLSEISNECTKINNMKDCLQEGCIWFKQKHPWFNSNCIPSKTFENIGINCTSSCVFSRHYSHIGFSPSGKDGGMMLNQVGNFNPPSFEHLATALDCCFPKNNSAECKKFSNQFKNLPSDVNPYFKIAYDQFAQCSSSCTPKTCSQLGKQCGNADDGCGGTLKCGGCISPKTCNSTGQCVCQSKTCSQLGKNCGSVSYGCGVTLNCGTCPAGNTCKNNICIYSCQPSGKSCYMAVPNVQSDCCVNLRCSHYAYQAKNQGTCIACLTSGTKTSDSRLCCSSRYKWVWVWPPWNSGYRCT